MSILNESYSCAKQQIIVFGLHLAQLVKNWQKNFVMDKIGLSVKMI